MNNVENTPVFDFFGTHSDDKIVNGFSNAEDQKLNETSDDIVKINGLEGDDLIITTQASDLAAGDMVGDEWTFVDGKWTYDASAVVLSTYGKGKSFDDIIQTGNGNDVLLGNGGHDQLFAGHGNDIVNAGTGDDLAYGGYGDDIINLENGNDYAEAGFGNDVVNAGNGNDVVYGDVKGDNLLAQTDTKTTTFNSLVNSGAWTMLDTFGESTISQSAQTIAGETYTISFGLAANLSGGYSTGAVEVLWNGEVVATVEATSGVYETFEVDVLSNGEDGKLSFHALDPVDNGKYNFDGPIISYDKEMKIGGEAVSVQAFAPGQANLYQVIDGQLNVFGVDTKEYIAVGDQPNFKVNAVGFNVEDDLIYGVAKSKGVDSLGNIIDATDIVMMDAAGATYRIGEGFYGDYVGDFDDSGNLWTFHSGLNRVSVVDVDQLDKNGNPDIKHHKFDADLFGDRTYDIAFNAADGNFYAVVAPGKNGQAGKVVKIDLSTVKDGGTPTFSEIAVTGTLYGDTMKPGMVKGAYGALFLDGEGNLYFGLNKGDHDLDASTGVEGAIFKINVDWDKGQAYAEFMSEAPSTGSNDGAVDPRSSDIFSEIDADAAVLIQEPTLTLVDGGNDILRGGEGNDELHGNAGDDELNGGTGDDVLFGDQGNDNISAGSDNDWVSGGTGNDKIRGQDGDDVLSGDDGNDYLHGGNGNDQVIGGNGVDKIVGGAGSDVIEGGAGNDNLWGGNWGADSSADTFVFNSGTGKDYVHDFETGLDFIDLSGFDTSFEAVQKATTDLGWATVIDLSDLNGGQAEDKIVLMSVDAGNLTDSDFIF